MEPIKITSSERGFHDYGESVVDSYGTTFYVRESSSASGPHVWVFVEENLMIFTRAEAGKASLHLDKDQAQALITRLQAWLNEIPERWGDLSDRD